MKKITLLLLLISFSAFSQEKYVFNPDLPVITVGDMLKHADSLFFPGINVSFAYTSDHLKPYDRIEPDAAVDPDYLSKKMDALKTDSLSPLNYSDLGVYYSNMGDGATSREYYGKAYERLKYFKVGKDSAGFYSYSALVKLNLGQDGVPDVEKALSINPADSLAFIFYPMMLINNGRYTDAKRVLKPLLEYDDLKYSAYMFLGIVEMYEKVQTVTQSGRDWVEVSKELDIATAINMEPYERNFSKKDKFFRHQQELTRLFNCFMKLSPSIDPKNNIIPSKKDFAYLEERAAYFSTYVKEKDANKYSAYMCLATTSWLKKDFTTAIAYYEKALKSFPAGKENFNFRTPDAYSGIATLYIIQKDYDKAIAVSLRKLDAKLLDNTDKAATLYNLGKLYYAKGDEVKGLQYAQEAVEVQETFDSMLFLAYMGARNGKNKLAEETLLKSEQFMQENSNFCTLLSYHIILNLANMQQDFAMHLYETNKQNLTAGCTGCEYLITHYLVEKK